MRECVEILKRKKIVREAFSFIVMMFLITSTGFSQVKPGPSNTGPSGTLATYAGSSNITVDGTVLENYNISIPIRVKANNVTIRNCNINTTSTYCIQSTFGNTGLLIEDCEIQNSQSSAVYANNFVARRCNVWNTGKDAFKANENFLIESCWIHHVGYITVDNHADGVQMVKGGNGVIRWNHFDMKHDEPGYFNSQCVIIQTNDDHVDNVVVDANWINGGGYSVQVRDKDKGFGPPTNVYVTNNKFGRDYQFGTHLIDGDNVFDCNAWEDTGEYIGGCSGSPTVATPVISPSSGTFTDPVTVSITCATSGAEIRYTLDGSSPTESSSLYSGSFVVSNTATVKARGYKADMNASSIATSTITISVPVAVTGVSISPTSLNLLTGQSSDLTETISPSNATNQSVTWASSNMSVATVNSNGLVTAVAEGNATITITTVDGGYTANCAVAVTEPVGGSNVALGKTVTQSTYQNDPPNVYPGSNIVNGDANDESRWSASGFPQWAEIDLGSNYDLSSVNVFTYQDRAYQYIIEAKADGGSSYTTIVDRSSNAQSAQPIADNVSATARYVKITVSGASGYTGSWVSLTEVEVYGALSGGTISVTGVSVSPTSLALTEGQTSDLTETVSPVDATDKRVNWSSSNSSIATVDANGLVTAIAAGNATITVTTVDGGFTANCSVSVTPAIIYVTGVSVSPTSLSLDVSQTADLTETVSPSNATDKSVSWSSSNSSIATVNASGLVTAVAEGSATITVTTTDGSFTANCAVTVSAPTQTWTELTYDDFESGWGNFSDGGGDCNLYAGGTYAHQGSNAGQIQDNSGNYSTFYYTNSVDLSSYAQLKIEFWFYGLGMDDGHEFLVEYSDNGGSSWQTIATYVQGAGNDFVNGQFYEVSGDDVQIDNGAYNFLSNAKIRFRCNAYQNDDQVYIDEVKVSATTSGSSSANVNLADALSPSVKIYPNPLNAGILNIAVNGYNEAVNVVIYDLTGRSVYVQQCFNQTEVQIPASNFNSGIYIVSVNGKQQKLVVK